MVSALLCRGYGFGLKISKQQLDEINFSRGRGKRYKDEGVVMEVFGTFEKQQQKESPLKYFEFGMNNEGYK
jgi:hypothetical protein